MDTRHVSVLAAEVLRFLAPRAGEVMVDGTLGGGGHSRQIVETMRQGTLVAMDTDEEATKRAEPWLPSLSSGVQTHIINRPFNELRNVLKQLKLGGFDGLLLDLGLSSDQLDDPARGFGFAGEVLDMRMFVPKQKRDRKIYRVKAGETLDRMRAQLGPRLTAYHLVNGLSEKELTTIMYRYGQESRARSIARAIVTARQTAPLQSAQQLALLIKKHAGRPAKIHPATKTFQALRIAVNDELARLEKVLAESLDLANHNARIVVISFHSLEDRIVKHFFKEASHKDVLPATAPISGGTKDVYLELLTKKPIVPSETELGTNHRSRSAKLRAARVIKIKHKQ